MKQNIKKIVIFFAFFMATVIVLSLQLVLISRSNVLPNGILVSSQHGMNISFLDCDNEKMQVTVSGCVTDKGYVTSEFSTIGYPVMSRLIYTNEDYPQIVPMQFLSGGYFVQSEIREANRYVVISDSLSINLFKTYDATGQTLTIDESEYTVCGVYKQNDSFLSEVSSDGLEQIYLSYSNLAKYEKAPILQLYIKGEKGQLDESVIAKVQLPQNPPLYYDNITNYFDMKQVIDQTVKIPWFLFGLNVIAFLVCLFIKRAKKTYLLIKNSQPQKSVVRSAMIGLAFLVAIVLVFFTTKFDLFIPTKMIPPDNIFDITFYLDIIAKSIQSHNVLQLYDFYWNYSSISVLISTLYGMVLSILLVILWWYGVKTVKCIKEEV